MQIGGSGKPMTEAQGKNITFTTRMEGAGGSLNGIDQALTDRGDAALGAVPFGLGRSYQDDNFQLAQQAGQEWLLAFLRKDSGAATTKDEEALYGRTYLPQPGDSEALIQQKRESRTRALAAAKGGMEPLEIVRQEKALQQKAKADESTPDADGWQTLPGGVKIRAKP